MDGCAIRLHFQHQKLAGLLFIICTMISTLTITGSQCKKSTDETTNQKMPSLILNKNYSLSKNLMIKGSLQSKVSCSDDSSCPPWFYCDTKDECKCETRPTDLIHCNNDSSTVLDCYCVTTNEQNKTVLGACIYNCGNNRRIDPVYHLLPSNIYDLNDICSVFNRTGALCGQCEQGLYLPVYSYDLNCIHCSNRGVNWLIFILAAFTPLTFFYFIVLFFKINANSSHLHGYVFYSQTVTIPAFCRIVLRTATTYVKPAIKVEIALFAIWNLDFFRSLIPSTICLQTNTLQTLALDYTIAVYPLFLMIISYIMIELHDRNFRIVVQIWRPFRLIFTFFRRNWDSRTSVIDAYATFFLLSYVRFLSVSFDLLFPTRLYELNSNKTTMSRVLYYDGSIEYFGKEHLPYAILALMVLVFFVGLPTAILLFYPFRCFQKFLNCFPIRWHILHTFVDSFQGCYKDGTKPGERDCRWFAALFLLLRSIGFLVYAESKGSVYFVSVSLVLLLFLLLLVTVQPFKEEVAHYAKINAAFLIFLILLYCSILGINITSVQKQWMTKPYYTISAIIAVIPLFYITCIAIHWLISRRKWGKEFIQRIRAWRQGYNWWELEDSDFEDSLPDRINNPGQYHEGNLSNFPIQNYSSVNQIENCSVRSVATY